LRNFFNVITFQILNKANCLATWDFNVHITHMLKYDCYISLVIWDNLSGLCKKLRKNNILKFWDRLKHCCHMSVPSPY
jgi:hypothetical protein